MPRPSKPTAAQLYKRFMRGESFYHLWRYSPDGMSSLDIEDAIRAYLKRRDARRKAK